MPEITILPDGLQVTAGGRRSCSRRPGALVAHLAEHELKTPHPAPQGPGVRLTKRGAATTRPVGAQPDYGNQRKERMTWASCDWGTCISG